MLLAELKAPLENGVAWRPGQTPACFEDVNTRRRARMELPEDGGKECVAPSAVAILHGPGVGSRFLEIGEMPETLGATSK